MKRSTETLAQTVPMQNDVFIPAWNRTGRIQLLDYLIIFSCMVILPASVLHGLLSIDERTAFALVAPGILYLFWVAKKGKFHKSIPMLVLTLMLTGAVASTISMSTSQLLMGTMLASAIVLGRHLFFTLSKSKVLQVVTWFTLALLVGGVIGIAYAFAGGAPLMEVTVGYRTTYLYLTTFSFAFIGNTIRPSGIFDEPGSLAMYATIVTMFNDTLRQNPRLNNVLVILLIFTGALAGLAMAALYLVASNSMRARFARNITLVCVLFAGVGILSFVAPSNLISNSVDVFYSNRLTIEDGRLTGDNRTNQIIEFFQIVDRDILLAGASGRYEDFVGTDQSSNPFSIIFGYGFIMWVPYFILLMWLLRTTIHNRFRNAYSSVGLFLLLLQRPYLYNMSWSVLILATVWLIYTSARQRPKRTVSN